MTGKLALLPAAALLLLSLGCNSNADIGSVTGVVTFNGKAVPEGTITFYPDAGGRPATGKLQPDGSYELSTASPGDGALIGEYKVAIEAKQVTGGAPVHSSLQEEIANPGGGGPSKVTWLVPEKYASAANSDLTATVTGGDNNIDFKLP